MAGSLFKCFVQFPKVDSSNEDQEDEKNSFEIIHKSEVEDHPPAVVLLGWAGCQEKHLAKYAAIYERNGFITVKVTVPSQTLYFQAHKLGEVAENLMEILAEYNITSNPIFFHMFSNGGCMVYREIISLLYTPGSQYFNKLSICGLIFDSSPGKRRILNAVKAFMTTLPFATATRYLMGLCLLVYLFVTRVVLELLPVELEQVSHKGFQLFNSICTDPATCPQLFLYSQADEVILAEDVEAAVEARRQRGVSVKTLCWADSAHVAHLRLHPDAYARAITGFTHACLKPTPLPAKL